MESPTDSKVQECGCTTLELKEPWGLVYTGKQCSPGREILAIIMTHFPGLPILVQRVVFILFPSINSRFLLNLPIAEVNFHASYMPVLLTIMVTGSRKG